MKKYLLRSSFECLVKAENEECLLDSNSQLIFDYPQKVLIYPLNCNRLSYPFSIDLSLTEGENFKVFQYQDKILFYLQSPYSIKNEIVEEVTCLNKQCELQVTQETLSFKVDNIKKKIPLLMGYKTYSLQVKDSFVLVFLNGIKDTLYAFNVKDYSIDRFEGKKIELLDNKIFISDTLNDISSHQIYDTFEIKENQIIKISGKFKLEEGAKFLKSSIVSIAFIESVKIKDFILAISYLDENLQKTTTPEHLEKYFGNIKQFLVIEENIIAITNEKEDKIYNFTLEGDKIKEIDILH